MNTEEEEEETIFIFIADDYYKRFIYQHQMRKRNNTTHIHQSNFTRKRGKKNDPKTEYAHTLTYGERAINEISLE